MYRGYFDTNTTTISNVHYELRADLWGRRYGDRSPIDLLLFVIMDFRIRFMLSINMTINN